MQTAAYSLGVAAACAGNGAGSGLRTEAKLADELEAGAGAAVSCSREEGREGGSYSWYLTASGGAWRVVGGRELCCALVGRAARGAPTRNGDASGVPKGRGGVDGASE